MQDPHHGAYLVEGAPRDPATPGTRGERADARVVSVAATRRRHPREEQ